MIHHIDQYLLGILGNNIGVILSALIENNGSYQNVEGRKTKVLCLSRTALMEKLGFVNPRYNKSRIVFRNQNIEENAEIYEDFVSEWMNIVKNFLVTVRNKWTRIKCKIHQNT